MKKTFSAACSVGVILAAFSISHRLASADQPHTITSSTSASDVAKTPTRDETEYKEIFNLYQTGDYETALKHLNNFERYYQKSPLQSAAENLHGMIYLLLKQPAQAIPHFKKATILPSAQPNFGQYAAYNLATAQFESNELDDAQDTINNIHLDQLDHDNQIKVHYLKAGIFQKRSLPLEAARECLIASRVGTNPSIAALLELALNDVPATSTLQELYTTYGDSPIADIVLYHLATAEIRQGDRSQGKNNFQTLLTKYPTSIHAAQAADALKADQNLGPVEKMSVGVLLPLKGKFARFGNRTLEAIELGFGIFGQDQTGSNVTLVIEDSGEEPEQAIQALERLANQHRVVAVIGPLLSKGIDAVAQRAQELGVPLISLARSTPVSFSNYSNSSGNSFFQAGVTLQQQSEQIAKYAVDHLKFTRFAEVYPKDKVGIESGNLFWDAIDALGGQMRGVETYTPDETDFRQVIDKLSGLYYTEARQGELDELAKIRTDNKIKKHTRKTEQYFNLKPVVDYQAVFIAEEPKVTGQILPTFAYRDVDHVRFLGTAAWNSPELYQRAQNYADGVLFPDAFYPGTFSTVARHFIDTYKSNFNVEPTTMEAIAYDVALVLNQALSNGSAPDRDDLRARLLGIKDFTGATGKITIAKGLFSRDLKILTYEHGKVVEAD
jgi:ABC-type branched-subunit amino acid transport system substrate-binding protein/predicted negative regulator of RcsB-dependent stress response